MFSGFYYFSKLTVTLFSSVLFSKTEKCEDDFCLLISNANSVIRMNKGDFTEDLEDDIAVYLSIIIGFPRNRLSGVLGPALIVHGSQETALVPLIEDCNNAIGKKGTVDGEPGIEDKRPLRLPNGRRVAAFRGRRSTVYQVFRKVASIQPDDNFRKRREEVEPTFTFLIFWKLRQQKIRRLSEYEK